jgi:branched-chain amino acid transport system ATP-binding protein
LQPIGHFQLYCFAKTFSGSSLVIVEQDIVQALKAANHVYCLQEGRIALTGAAATLTREAISAAYFGA